MNPDKKVIDLMNSLGSKVTESRPVHFYFYFPTEMTAQTFAKRLKGMQFSTEIISPMNDEHWLCLAERTMIPNSDILEGLRKLLSPLSENLGGYYDGWETEMLF